MSPLTITVYMGDVPATMPLVHPKPVPIILNHEWSSFPLGVVRLKVGDGGTLLGDFYFNNYKPEYDLLYPSLGGVMTGDSFDCRCVGIHASPNVDVRIKTFGEQLKAQRDAAEKNKGTIR